jgi:hypothetical protein
VSASSDPLAVLRRLRAEPAAGPQPRPRAGERCELCTVDIGEHHGHLVDLESRGLLCACRPCYLLFTADGAGGRRYRAVPDRHLSFPDLVLAREVWEALQIPVSVAFFFLNSELGRVAAFYPGPAGATESLLSLETWDTVLAAHPALGTLQPDVEALLVRTERGGDAECFLVPIDACYELVGRLRRLWRGFDGGSEAHAALDEFFTTVRAKAEPAPADAGTTAGTTAGTAAGNVAGNAAGTGP